MIDTSEYFEKPCYIIDFLPKQVPIDCGGQFFEVETYLINNCDRYGQKDRFIRIILKLMCYYRVSVHWDMWIEQPAPERLVEIIEKVMCDHHGQMDILFPEKNALLQFDGDCLNLSIYDPDDEMCSLLEQLAWSEGMFFRIAID